MDSSRAAAERGVAVVQESAVCADSSIGCVYTFPRGTHTAHLVATCCATGARVSVALEPPLAFGVATAELNRAGTLLLVVGGVARTALACIDLTACRDRLAEGAEAGPLTARTFAVGAECVHRARLAAGPVHAWAQHRLLPFVRGAAAAVLRAHWHPLSAQHALVLTRDACLHLFDVLRDPAAPEQSWALAPSPACPPRTFPPVSFACTHGPAASGWAACAVHVVHADGAVSVLCPVVPRDLDPNTAADDSRPEFEGEGEEGEEEPKAELQCVVCGEGVVRVDAAYDVAVAAEHGACGAAAPCVLVRSDGRGRLDCFAAYPPPAPRIASDDYRNDDDDDDDGDAMVDAAVPTYPLVDRVVLPHVPRSAADPAPGVVVVQDATRAADLVVLQPGRAALLHVDYSVARDRLATATSSAAPPALLVPLLVAPAPPQPFAGAALVVRPGAPPRIAVLEQGAEHAEAGADAPQLHWCRCPRRLVLRVLAAVPPACRAPFVRALCPLPDDAAASPLLAALVQQLQRTTHDLHARAVSIADEAAEQRPHVEALARRDAEVGAAVARVGAQQDALWARVDALLATPCFAEHLAESMAQCSAELAAIAKRVDARSQVVTQVCCLSHSAAAPVALCFIWVCAVHSGKSSARI